MSTSRHKRRVALGIYWCKYSTHPQHKMSALAFNTGGVLAGGANSLKTHPKAATYGNHLHAELAMIFAACNDELWGTTVLVTRVKKSGALGTSKPCEVCWAALKEAGVKDVVYYEDGCWRKERM